MSNSSTNSIDYIEQALENSIPKVIVFCFILLMETIVVFAIDRIFNTCSKKKRKTNYNIQSYSSFSSSITNINFDSLGKDFDKNTDTETLRKRVYVLQTEHKKYDCPSTFVQSAKLSREINRINQILESRNTDEIDNNSWIKAEIDITSYMTNYFKDMLTINSFVRIIFKIVYIIFLWICRDLTIYLPGNTIFSWYFTEGERAN